MKEVSAGGVIVYHGRGGWHVLLMKDMNGNWTFPKGRIEGGEEKRATATREIEEEVGVKELSLLAELTPTTYWYYRGKPIKKTVHYYLFRSKTRQKLHIQKDEGISEAKWVRFSDAPNSIGYPKTNLVLLHEVQKTLWKLS